MKGLLIILSGPSGAGKGTVLNRALELNKNLKVSVSVTTRKPRDGEVNGINYFFKTINEYKDMLHNGEFLENEEVYGNLYGTPRKYVEDLTNQGYDVILEIDTKGALNVKKQMQSAVMVFLTPKDNDTLTNRLVGRNTESQDELEKRLGCAKKEIQEAINYDYVIVNDDVEVCCEQFMKIIEVEKLKASRNINFIKSFC